MIVHFYMKYCIIQGDFLDAPAEALLNPTSIQVDLSWGSDVSARIHYEAKGDVIVERAAAGTLKLGEACLTSAGDLRCRAMDHRHVR